MYDVDSLASYYEPLSDVGKGDVIRTIKDLVRYNKSQDLFIVGKRGIGKSTTQLAIAVTIMPTFTVNNIVFDSDEFMQRVEEANIGDVVIFDESGMNDSGTSSRASQTKDNKRFADVWQMIRTKRIITIFVSLDVMRVDKRVRETFAYYVTPERQLSYEATNVGLQIACKIVEQNKIPTNDNELFTYKYDNIKYAKKGKVHEYVFFLPSAKLIKEYEVKRNVALKKALNKKTNVYMKV